MGAGRAPRPAALDLKRRGSPPGVSDRRDPAPDRSIADASLFASAVLFARGCPPGGGGPQRCPEAAGGRGGRGGGGLLLLRPGGKESNYMQTPMVKLLLSWLNKAKETPLHWAAAGGLQPVAPRPGRQISRGGLHRVRSPGHSKV